MIYEDIICMICGSVIGTGECEKCVCCDCFESLSDAYHEIVRGRPD